MFGAFLHQILAIVPVAYGEFSLGIGYGWTSPILKQLHKTEHYSLEELSWIGSIHEFGRMIGPFLAAVLLDRIGRKKILIFCCSLFVFSWIFITFTAAVEFIYLGRLLFGIGNGIHDVASSVYLGENYPPNVRGIFCGVIVACFCGAELIQFVTASILPYNVVSLLSLGLSVIGLLMTVLLIETPQYLLMKDKGDKARHNFEYLRGADENNEYEKIKENIKEEISKKASLKELFFTPANRKSLIIIFLLNVFTMGTGYSVVLSYMSILFSSSHRLTDYQFTVLFGVCQLVSSVCATWYIERFNRRTLILCCFSLVCVVHGVTTGLLYVQENVCSIPYFTCWIFLTISTYGAIYACLFTVVHMIRGEIFPQSIKAIGGFVAITVHSFMAFVTAKLFLIVADRYGTYVNFLFFSVLSLISFVYNYFQLPETRGKILVDIHNALKKSQNV